jgi:hypothetical protein
MLNYVIQNVENVNVSQNEIVSKHSLNRNFEKLLQNDKELVQLAMNIISSATTIKSYVKGLEYNRGNYVWFTPPKNDSTYSLNLYLLECMYDGNANSPTRTLVDGIYTFETSGWKNKNDVASIMSENLYPAVLDLVAKKMMLYHSYMKQYHKFDRLSSDEQAESKILLANMSNIDDSRSTNFYPYRTFKLSADAVITNGFCRVWGNGVLEYDILYQLGYSGTEYIDNVEYDKITCNNLSVLDISSNSKYFLTSADYDIFSCSPTGKQVIIRGMVQKNKEDYVNSYSATLKFPVSFKDLNYMLFSSEITRQEKNTESPTVDTGSNAISYANKTLSSISPVYIMFNDLSMVDGAKSGLVSNSFHCHAIGRWK